ncbi:MULTISPECIES: Rrf2 family transcriptional regulator [Peptoniphilus]|uniref:RrF2 family transcriptional regulator n=1 Tax=Peptoniphilus TaxID=162289 RepID=UPI0001DA9C9E|nr:MULTISPECIES: Rrf2 family transcriptional regulator [Peptoniphilus]EFI42446.1 putative HTH-type transcriptional regulator IscR [Peptoniphilus sp. oral taxon 386 str. F0131]
MKLSTKGRYGLMAMYRLSLNYGNGPTPINDIAKEEKLSEAYLEQLFTLLKKKNLVKSIRGAAGGYELAKSPSEIKIGEILNALEGDIALSCSSMNIKPECRNVETCPTREILEKLQIKLEEVLDSMTLADMR